MSLPSATTAAPAGIYARVSTLAQGEDEKTSLQVQENTCSAFAPTAGLRVDPDCVAREPFTATTIHRPALDRLLDTMVRKGVRHLIMDKADRVTREGQVVAAVFLQGLLDRGITLHLALERLTLDNETAVMVFLTMAYAAQKDNEYRVANVQRNRREAARTLGRYARGNRPPYGWQFVPREVDAKGRPVSFRLVHDPDTFPVLVRMLHVRLVGDGYWKIAKRLTDEGVPSPEAGQGGYARADGKPWRPSSVQRIIRNPINAGLATSFRQRREQRPPDAHHPRRWSRSVKLPLAEHIPLPADLVQDPPITVEQWRWLVSPDAHARRVGTGYNVAYPEENPAAPNAPLPALFAGGMLTHAGACGGHLRVKRAHRGSTQYVYYVCRRHDDAPSVCPGITVPVTRVDTLVWDAVRRVLLTPGLLEEMAEEQRRADQAALGADGATGDLRHLEQVRADLIAQRGSLADSIARNTDLFLKATLEEKLIRLGPALAEAEERLAEARALTADDTHRQDVLAVVRQQLGQYAFMVELLHTLPPEVGVPMQRHVLRAVGFTGAVAWEPAYDGDGGGKLAVEAQLRLSKGTAHTPWFTSPSTGAMPDDPAQHLLWEKLAESLPRERATLGIGEEFAQWLSAAARPTPSSDAASSVPPPEAAPLVYRTEAGTVTFVQPTTSSR